MQLSKARTDLGRMTARAADQELSPQEQHAAANSVPRLLEEAANLGRAIDANGELIEEIETLIRRIEISSHRSARRTIAVRKLEEASDSLRRELGDHPTD